MDSTRTRWPRGRRIAVHLSGPIALILAATGGAADPEPEGSPATRHDPVLRAIVELESTRDAKCHSSANRFEDFLFGTPLSQEAREASFALQKRLASRLWRRASLSAAASGAGEVSLEVLRPELERVAIVRREGEDRVIQFPDREAIHVPERRALQYATIAYSLRALLAAEQDFAISGETPPLPLASESVSALRDTLDLAAIAALERADAIARERSEYEISEAQLREAWHVLVPEVTEPQGAEGAELAAAAVRAKALALLDGIVEGKDAAYRSYNELDARDADRLLVFNISRFYARRPLSRQRSERREFVRALESQLDAFSAQLLLEADTSATARSEVLVRAADANAAVDALMPQRVDEFEDVHVFERVDAARVTLEAFDCDSFRDFGVHWRSLQRAAHAGPPSARLPDPFAAEILAEAVSVYGVLLLRVAGEEAATDEADPRLRVDDLASAAESIRQRAARHHASPQPSPIREPIRSAQVARPALAGALFRDATADAGVAFTHRSSRWLGEFRHKQLKTPPTFSGGGVAAEDLDDDGDVDLLFVGGGGNALLANDGRGRFRDVTAEAGLSPRREDGSHGEARAPIIADFDNDGLQDVLITYVDDDHRLYRGLGGLRFQDVSAASGLGGSGLVGGPATVFDFDGDGLLDVYVAYFGDYLRGAIPTFDRDNQNALPNRLFRNRGGLRFEDVSRDSGAMDTGWTQAVSHVDFDRDGRQDLIVANDYGRNAFLRNLGGGRFEDVAPRLGITDAFHSMNVGVADLNDDDHPDVYISNLATLVKDDKYSFPDVNTPLHFDLRAMSGMLVKESDLLYMSHVEDGRLAGFVPSTDVERGATSTGWAWDAEFFDVDHDGDDDLYLVNGTNDFNVFSTIYPHEGPDGGRREILLDHKRESNVLFLNEGGKLRNRSPGSGADLVANSRSTAYLDYDGDGDLDVAVNNFHAPAVLLRNDAEKAGHWLGLRLRGDPERGISRDAIGARVVVRSAGGRSIRREVQGGSGYLSMNPKRIHVGLGHASSADVEIVWPDGERQILRGLAADADYHVVQGSGAASVARLGAASEP